MLKFIFCVALLIPLMPVMGTQGAVVDQSGSVFIRSSTPGYSDQLVIWIPSVYGLAEDQEYWGWLISDDGSGVLDLGALNVHENDPDRSMSSHSFRHTYRGNDGEIGDIMHKYTHPSGLNLAAAYSKFVITVERIQGPDDGPSSNILYSDLVSTSGMQYVRDLLFSRDGNTEYTSGPHSGLPKGVIPGLYEQANAALNQATLAASSTSINDTKVYAKHVINIIEGSTGDNYDMSYVDPGDGFGLLGYADNVEKYAELAVSAASNDNVFAKNETGVAESAENVRLWAEAARNRAIDAFGATDSDEAKSFMIKASGLLEKVVSGHDSDGDGLIRAVADEGGVIQVEMAAQNMSSFSPMKTFIQPELPDTGDVSLLFWAKFLMIAGAISLTGGTSLLLRRRNVA
jgi:hypothetical protein